MNIVQLTPGAGGMYCGNCFRDNASVAALRQLGHQPLLVPLYLPLRLDEHDESAGVPVFFSGINVYFEERFPAFRRAPRWLRRLLAHPRLLALASGRAAKTRPEDVGDLTLSMLRGEEGNQARDLEELLRWLRHQPPPDLVCLSNALLLGLARRLRDGLGVPVVCTLQGEDTFLDSLPPLYREQAWEALAERATDAELFIAPSRSFGEQMARRIGVTNDRLRIVANGISLDGYPPSRAAPQPPVLGFFTRMCREKGLDTLIEAFLLLRQRQRVPGLRLKIGGGCGPRDEPFVHQLRARLERAGALGEAEFHPNLSRAEKIAFLHSLTVFSVPATYGEAFGLYLLEALAAGVPVVQPRHGAFPEIIEATGGGVLCEPHSPSALADALEELLLDDARIAALGRAGRAAIEQHFTAEALAQRSLLVFEEARARHSAAHPVLAGVSL